MNDSITTAIEFAIMSAWALSVSVRSLHAARDTGAWCRRTKKVQRWSKHREPAEQTGQLDGTATTRGEHEDRHPAEGALGLAVQ